LAPTQDRNRFKLMFENPPQFNLEMIRDVFGVYYIDPRHHILRGLAECFSRLDDAYKSHAKVRVGVKGLPKRIIISGFGGFGQYGKDAFKDVINAIASYKNTAHIDYQELYHIEQCLKIDGNFDWTKSFVMDQGGEREKFAQSRGVKLRLFGNGNLHVAFDEPTLLDINKALAEFYGDVLPDVQEQDAEHHSSTQVAKDLAYYPTPQAVVQTVLNEVYFTETTKILEPSCGDGRILDGLKKSGAQNVLGIEIDRARAEQAKRKGHNVFVGNFLDQEPTGDFDLVIMNPPFVGRHYLLHVNHALKFLKDGGKLVTILPASAYYDHQELQGRWSNLPVASFRDSGTNISTGYLIMNNRVELQRCA